MPKAEVGMRAILLVASMFLASAHSLEASVLCKKKSGVVVAREVCKKGETALDLSQYGAVGPQGLQGPVGPQGPPGPGAGPAIRDATGALIAPLDTGLLLFLNDESRPVGIWVDSNGFVQDDVSFLFEASDCTGTPLLGVEEPSALIMQAMIRATTAYYPHLPTRMATVQSQLTKPFTQTACGGTPSLVFVPPDGCCSTNLPPRDMTVGVAASLDLNTLGLTPPFHVEPQ